MRLKVTVSQKDIWVLICMWPFFATLIAYKLFDGRMHLPGNEIFTAVCLFVFFFIISWRMHIYADHYFRGKLPDIKSVPRRVLLSLGIHFLIMVTYVSTFAFIMTFTRLGGYTFGWQGYLRAIFTGLCGNIATIGFHEGVYMFDSWKRTLQQTEGLKKNNLQSRLMGLKNQVNPHFLFNSLNTLSSLISEDSITAEKFLNELCKVYRYLLGTERENLTTLRAELAFLQSWFYIMKTRYGAGIDLTIDVPDDDGNKYLPVLTLITVAEDVIAQNTISKSEPLLIEIKTNSRYLLIANLQRAKRNAAKTTANTTELNHLTEKYRLMGAYSLTVSYSNHWRYISIPLLKTPVLVSPA